MMLDIEKLATEAGCWIWMASDNGMGYGTKRVIGKSFRVHRLMYELFNGTIPEGMMVLHSCDTPICCNPAHLSVGTQKDNMGQCKTRGRNRHTSTRGKFKYNPSREVISKARSMYTGSHGEFTKIASELGITEYYVRLMVLPDSTRYES